MKPAFLLTLAALFVFAGCGKDNKSNSNTGYFTNSLSTQEGFYSPNTNTLTVGGQVVNQDMNSYSVIRNALMQAQYSRIPQTMLGNQYGYRARVTGQLTNYGNNMGYPGNGYGYPTPPYMPGYGYNTGYPQTGYNSGYGQTVTITSIQFY